MQYIMSKPIIGIVGPKGSGKSTLAQYLIPLLEKITGILWIRIAFGDALKREVSELYGIPAEWMYDEQKKETPLEDLAFPALTAGECARWAKAASFLGRPAKTIREVLQVHGTEIRRAEDPNYWNKLFLAQVDCLENTGVICDDVRFLDEACIIREIGGVNVRVWHYDGELYAGEHRSEAEMQSMTGFDMIVSPERGELQACANSIAGFLRETLKRVVLK